MGLWQACQGAAGGGPVIGPLAGELVRLVESQEQIATNALVDDLAEQALLETMLERAKPTRLPGTERLHYLLATPFRYPPLRHGSRFGAAHRPGIFYGAQALRTALAETAYYRFLFWAGMSEPPPAGRLTTEHTAFGAHYRTQRGLRLHTPPCDAHRAQLTDPASYAQTQPLGDALRDADVEAFEYRSARETPAGINVAVLSPSALADEKPSFQQPWLCEATADAVAFLGPGAASHRYALEQFLVGGGLPRPGVR